MSRVDTLLSFLVVVALGALLWNWGNSQSTQFIEPQTGDYVVETTSLLSRREVSRKPTILEPKPDSDRVIISRQTRTFFSRACGVHRGSPLSSATTLLVVADHERWPSELRHRVSNEIWAAYWSDDYERLRTVLDVTSAAEAAEVVGYEGRLEIDLR